MTAGLQMGSTDICCRWKLHMAQKKQLENTVKITQSKTKLQTELTQLIGILRKTPLVTSPCPEGRRGANWCISLNRYRSPPPIRLPPRIVARFAERQTSISKSKWQHLPKRSTFLPSRRLGSQIPNSRRGGGEDADQALTPRRLRPGG